MTLIQAKQLRSSAPHQACVSPNPNGDDKRCPLCRMADDIIRSEPPTLGAQGRADKAAERERWWRDLAGCMYQAAGAHDFPVLWMDVLSAATKGAQFDIEELLPIMPRIPGSSMSILGTNEGYPAVSLAPSEPVSPQAQKFPDECTGANGFYLREHPMSESPLPVQGGQVVLRYDSASGECEYVANGIFYQTREEAKAASSAPLPVFGVNR